MKKIIFVIFLLFVAACTTPQTEGPIPAIEYSVEKSIDLLMESGAITPKLFEQFSAEIDALEGEGAPAEDIQRLRSKLGSIPSTEAVGKLNEVKQLEKDLDAVIAERAPLNNAQLTATKKAIDELESEGAMKESIERLRNKLSAIKTFSPESDLSDPQTHDDLLTADEGMAAVIAGNNKFAFDMYARLEDDKGNLFFSPWSITTALAMTYEGARGETAEEIRSVFSFPSQEEARHDAFSSLQQILNPEDAPYKLSIANALWVQQQHALLPEYIKTVSDFYGGKATNLDFIGDSENSRITINKWVEAKTNNKIIELLPEGTINELTRLVITNAIYFKGNWNKEFNPEYTFEGLFHAPSGDVPAMMMKQSDEFFPYMENDEVQMLEMPYKGEQLSMLVVLPKGDLGALDLTLDNLESWKAEMNKRKPVVAFPKFTFTEEYELGTMLSALGMPLAFSLEADFSGLDGTKDLVIHKVLHKAFIEVNEEGTEAAAATGVVIGATSMPLMFTADHPFVFFIQEKETGSLLFMGRVEDPTA
ncbi:MAG: serpin family protein [Nanoarchaeota archaeon]